MSPCFEADPEPSNLEELDQFTDLTGVEGTALATVDESMPELPPASENFSPYDMAWPWLHEDIFLQKDLNLDWFDVPQASVDQNNGDIHVAQLDELCAIHNMPHTQRLGTPLNPPGVDVCGTLDQQDADAVGEEPFVSPKQMAITALIDSASAWTKQLSKAKHSTSTIVSFHAGLTSFSEQIALTFDIATAAPDYHDHPGNCLATFLRLYFDHFWPLWPLISKYQWDTQEIPPLLYLAMVSIGAMYGGKQASAFGTMLHNRLREEMVRPHFDYDVTDKDTLPLGQARSLTQAAALYFGQQRAFSYAQHIGGTLVAQARRMNLFCAASRAKQIPETGSDWVIGWMRRESCKRLAFAIMRLEMYTSVLHSNRPLVSGEEMDIEMPCSRFIWHHSFSSAEALAAAIRQESFMQRHRPLFSDVLRIALDPEEKLPYLETLDQELLLNAVQEHVWAACAARDSRGRFKAAKLVYDEYVDTGLGNMETRVEPYASRHAVHPASTHEDHLARHSRNMTTLGRRISEITVCLRKWQKGCSTDEVPTQITDRSSLLTSLLIYHLSFLQLHAPIEHIHDICHLPTSSTNANGLALETVRSWSKSQRAGAAARHAVRIFDLLNSEAQRDVASRASVNFLTMIGLYHSAVLLWVYSALVKERWNDHELDTTSSQHTTQLEPVLGKQDPVPTMEDFVKLFSTINPAWAARSSFCAAIQRLVKKPFPFD